MNPVEFPVTVGSQLAQEDDRVAQVLTAVALLAGVEHAVVGEQIRDTTAERLSISLRKTGKRLHAICKPGLWPREVQSLPAPSCII